MRCELYADNKALAPPIYTSLSSPSNGAHVWGEWITFAYRICDLPLTAQLAFTVLDVAGIASETEVGGMTLPLFGKRGYVLARCPNSQALYVVAQSDCGCGAVWLLILTHLRPHLTGTTTSLVLPDLISCSNGISAALHHLWNGSMPIHCRLLKRRTKATSIPRLICF